MKVRFYTSTILELKIWGQYNQTLLNLSQNCDTSHTDTHTQHTHINNSNVTDTWLTVNVKIKLIFQQLRWGKLNIFSGILIF